MEKKRGEQQSRCLKSILLVEDDVLLREVVKEAIEDEFPAYHVDSVITGAEALNTVEQHNTPDLIVSNYHLPDTDGLTMYEAIRKKNGQKQIPLLLMSAKDEVRGIFHARYHTEENMRFVGKPFRLDIMLHLIETLISCS